MKKYINNIPWLYIDNELDVNSTMDYPDIQWDKLSYTIRMELGKAYRDFIIDTIRK